jgi:hypothetical protein
MNARSYLPVLVVAMLLGTAPARSQEEDEIRYRVSGERLRCLIENAGQYLDLDRNLLTIAIDLCPEIVGDPLLAITRNENPELNIATDEDTLDHLIVLRTEELACIVNGDIALDAEVYEIFPERCLSPSSGDWIRPGT